MNDRQWQHESTDGAPSEGGQPAIPTDDAPQMPLSMLTGGDGSESDFGGIGDPFAAGTAGGHKNPLGGLLAVVVLLAVGGGTLWAMHMHNQRSHKTDSAVTTAEKKIDEALQRLAAAKNADSTDGAKGVLSADAIDNLLNDTDQIVALFSEDPTKRQVATENLAKNPFELTTARRETVQAPSSEAVAERRRQELRRKLESDLGRLKLQTVLSGQQSAAVISGNIVRIGDRVGPFEVTAIHPSRVELSAEGEAFSLSMVLPSIQR